MNQSLVSDIVDDQAVMSVQEDGKIVNVIMKEKLININAFVWRSEVNYYADKFGITTVEETESFCIVFPK